MPADAPGIRTHRLHEIFWTRSSLLLTTLVVVSGLAFWISSGLGTGTVKSLLTAVATGTMVSAVVGFGQTLITARATREAMLTPLVEESRKALRELAEEYRSLNQEFFPTHVFEASVDPDPSFNALMMADLRRARQYWFRGFSGRYAAVRLLAAHQEWEVRAVVADPRERSAISGRARHIARREGAESDLDAIRERLHADIGIGLVGLFLARSRCTRIDVTVVADPPVDRVEMFDDSVWITLFSDPATPSPYPRTLRFAESSFIHGMERADFGRLHTTRDARRLVITPETTRAEFAEQFAAITGIPLSDKGFAELETAFHAFRQDFSAKAELES